MASVGFHPATRAWFEQTFSGPTEVQAQAWPAIASGKHTLLAAPTGSGKTLAAFLASIDALIRTGLAGKLADQTYVLYVSPLKALSNDIQKNLQHPLTGIRQQLSALALPDVAVRAGVRTGDTPAYERQRMRKQAPHILVTTPESLYILLTSESGRAMLSTVRTVIVDEIHALAGNKRGAHLALSLERLESLCGQRLARVGLSATQKPIENIARFLTGAGRAECTIVDTGHVRERDLAIEVTGSPLTAVMPNEVWEEIYDRLAELIRQHKTTLIFVNTRRLAERLTRYLAERIGESQVTSHHGSLAREHRLDAETRLKNGTLSALVATASLELGIDIGDVDLVCQMGSPRSISAFLQRVGRSGHAVGGKPKGRLFPLSRDDLVESAAIFDAVRRAELDRIAIPSEPLDVLAQQIVAEVACGECDQIALYQSLRRAWPYRELARDRFDQVIKMLSQGYSTRRGRRSAYLHHDAVNGYLRPRKGAKLTAITNGGAIPDQFDYTVILQPEGLRVGSVNEDFAFESLPGSIFQLGNTSYRILQVGQGKVLVEDARGQPPNIPFWFGEAPGRSDELSLAVSRLRTSVAERLERGAAADVALWLEDELSLAPTVARQLADYLALAKAALGVLPTQQTLVFERFFDQTGDMHLVIHSPFGSRLNRAFGLALRKRFCRKFNFELQAAALEDSIVLSLGITHSFPLEEVAGYLKSASVRDLLIQALLDAPMFGTRWRWVATTALAIRRNNAGKKVPAQFQRSDSDDLMAVVFPDQQACLENIVGQREIPDHPLVNQTIADCLNETMDIGGLESVLDKLESGSIRFVCRDLTTPSPLAHEVVNARPYAFLDDAPIEERRTLAVQTRHLLNPADANALGRLDSAAIDRVRSEAWPDPGSADELHDALCVLGFVSESEACRDTHAQRANTVASDWHQLFAALTRQRRATALQTTHGEKLWVAAERLGEFQLLFPRAMTVPDISPVRSYSEDWTTPEEALREIIRSRLEGLGPVTAKTLAQPLGLALAKIELALTALETEGFAVRGCFSQPTGIAERIAEQGEHEEQEWCERRLLARIHRYTMGRLRREIEPVSPADFMRFLFHWQRLGEERGEGTQALQACLEQLEGYSLPAAAWEAEVLPARIGLYTSDMLDSLCASGRFVWLRLAKPGNGERRSTPVRNTPIALIAREHLVHWQDAEQPPGDDQPTLSATAAKVLDALAQRGASFFADLVKTTGLLRTQVESALSELAAQGLVSSDTYAGLRALITPNRKRPGLTIRRAHQRRRVSAWGVDEAGRWSVLFDNPVDLQTDVESAISAKTDRIERAAQALLNRYGVVFRKLLERETHSPPWRELLPIYHRMEARGELRGGRFVDGMSGEQFALSEAVGPLRDVRKREQTQQFIIISAADPLNLTGIITPGDRVPTQAANRVLYRDGIPVAVQVAGDIQFVKEVDENTEWLARSALLKHGNAAAFHPALFHAGEH